MKKHNVKSIFCTAGMALALCFAGCKKEVKEEVITSETTNIDLQATKLVKVTKFLSHVLNVPVENIKFNKAKDNFTVLDTLELDGKEMFIRYDEANVYKAQFENDNK